MNNLLQNLGLFVCVGALVLFALLAWAASSLARRNRSQNTTTQDQGVFNQPRGHERPTYDSQRVESSGGFGGDQIPQTGLADREEDNASFRPGSVQTFDRDEESSDDFEQRRRRSNDNDADADNDVRSSGGFGS